MLTYRYRIKDRSAAKHLSELSTACNQVWNWCVAQQKDVQDRYKAGARYRLWSSHFTLARACAGVGAELGIHQQTVQCVCQVFSRARDQNRRAPQFRASFGVRRSLGWIPFQKQSRSVRGNSITYRGKVYRWFGNKRRPLPETAKGGAFVEDAQGRWWVAFQVEVEALPTGSGAVGIDLGLKALATLSDGTTVPAPQHYRQYAERLAIAQRAGNRKRVAAIHTKIANARKDQMHKATTKIARENKLIVVGNVNAASLKKTRFAKSVSDAGWSMFRNALAYKASRHQAHYEEVNEAFTSVTCSACGARSGPKGQKGLRIREWNCSGCGAAHHRDHNAALNILALSIQRPVGESRRVAA